MTTFGTFRLRGHAAPADVLAHGLPPAHECREAQRRLVAKINAMGAEFFDFSKEQYGDWVDRLPRDEFVEYIAMAIA